MSESHTIFGVHAVKAALEHEPDLIKQLLLEHNRRDERANYLVKLARQAGVDIERVERHVLDDMVDGQRHQGVVAKSQKSPALNESNLETILSALHEPAFLLILDSVQDPHNLGACLRTADAAGVHAVIAPRDGACGLTSTVRKVASGAAESIPFIQVTNLVRTIKNLQQKGIWITGTDLDTANELYDIDLSGPIGLVLGAEGKGLRRLTRETCDSLVKLPMLGSVQSLNVSVSAGICLYEALRQREYVSNEGA